MALQRLEGFRHLPGKNCLTTAIRNILNYYGYRYQESLVFGLCEGLGFQFEQIAGLDNPYLGGTGRRLLQSFCDNLDLTFELIAFDNDEDAEKDLREKIADQIPVIVHVDLFYLPYFESSSHFAGHRVVPVGFENGNVLLADTGFEQIQSCPLASFAEARSSSYPPFRPHRRRFLLEPPRQKPFLEESITRALYNLVRKFQEGAPGYRLDGIMKLKENLGTYKSLRTLFNQIEKAGTGGGLSRRMFAEFLDQAFQIYSRGLYEEAAALYMKAAELWRQLAVGARRDDIKQAPRLLDEIYELESKALQTLSLFEADDL
jgi:hypothetical protein